MKKTAFWIVVAVMMIAATAVFAQSAVDWERGCPSGNVDVGLLDDGGALVRCFLGDVIPTETATPTELPTETATATMTPTATATITPTVVAPSGGIVVDHNSVALFDRIPDEYLTAARETRMMFSDRSVGDNINNALNCLASQSWALSPSYCRVDYVDATQTTRRTFNAADLANGVVPELIQFPASNVVYSRANWTYASCLGDWNYMVGYFINTLAPQFLASKDVLSCQFSYLNVTSGSTIMRYFTNTTGSDVFDLEAFIAQHPDKDFVFWTTSLARVIGTSEATSFNSAMRQYAIENDKILFDMADIMSHDRNGNPCELNGNPIICRDYTTELEGGHLGSVSGGQIVMAKAFWVLMAQIAGWIP